MTLTADALWLNSIFSGYDTAILGFAHKLAEIAGSVLTPLNKIITLLGEKGILFFLLAVILMLFPRWRKTGVCIFGAVCCGALITNFILKDYVARPRPFETVDLFRQWWQYVGAPAEDGFSFPSGHVTAAAAGVTGLCLMRGKRWLLPGVIWVLLMMFSRNYLMAHYPSDVLFALLIGIFSAFIAAAITHLIFRFLDSRSGNSKFCDILLYAGFNGISKEKDAEESKPVKLPRPSKTSDYNNMKSSTAGTAHIKSNTASPKTVRKPSSTENVGGQPNGSHANKSEGTASGSAKHVAHSSSGKNSSRNSSGTYVGKH